MWKRGGRSSALDRAQLLLRAKRSGGGSGQGLTTEPLTQQSVGGSVKPRAAPSLTQPSSLSYVSDVSSVSSVAEPRPQTVRFAHTGDSQSAETDSGEDVRPQSSVGGRSRFLKKPPAPTNSGQSPAGRIQLQQQQQPEPRYASSSQTAALRRLAEIESRVRSRKQVQAQTGRGTELAPTSDVSPPAAPRSPETPALLSADPGGDQSPKGNRFLKKKAAGAAAPAADAAFGFGSAGAAVPSRGVQRKSVKVTSGVSLESDEEDMRRLLGGSEESSDHSFLEPARTGAMKKLETSSGGDHGLASPPPPLRPSLPPGAASPRPPRSPPRRDSPFRFTGRAQARFSPASPSPPPSSAASPPRSLSAASALGEVLSLEELFPAGPGSREPRSAVSSVSEDFKINVMTLDDLVPAAPELNAETPSKKRGSKHTTSVSGFLDGHQQHEEEKEKEEEGEYPSDFESESRSAASRSDSQVSEQLHTDRGEDCEVSETSERRTRVRTEDEYSSAFSDPSRSHASPVSDRSQTSLSRSRSAYSKSSHGTRSSRDHSRRRAPARRTLKEAAVQTQPDPLAHTWLAGTAALDTAADLTSVDPTPVLTHTLTAEAVEALSSFNPALFALHELLKQQLASTKSIVQSRRHLHRRLLQSLEPPNYRYTTLEDTKQLIQKHRAPRRTLEEALEEVQQEMRDCHCA